MALGLLMTNVACATAPRTEQITEAIDGDPEYFPAAFEAARRCGVEGVRMVEIPSGPPHLMWSYSGPMSPEARCFVDWLGAEGRGHLYPSGH